MNSLSVLKLGLLAPSNSIPVSLGVHLKCKMSTSGMREVAGKNPVPTQETVRGCGEKNIHGKNGNFECAEKGSGVLPAVPHGSLRSPQSRPPGAWSAPDCLPLFRWQVPPTMGPPFSWPHLCPGLVSHLQP